MSKEEPKKAQQERLKNDEFRKLIPYLQLDEYFMIQTNIQSNWTHMFSVSFNNQKPNTIVCNICDEKLTFDTFKAHLNKETHKQALDEIDQFFHPIYTYAKTSEKLAKGISASEVELKEAIDKANATLTKTVEGKILQARRIAKYIQSLECGVLSTKFEESLITLALKTETTKPEHIFVEVSLPLSDLLKVEFSLKENEWEPMLTTDNPHPNSKYYCALCSKYCAGIITVNSHLNGSTHKKLQIVALGVRVPSYDKLTKNCSFRFDKKYSLTVKREGRSFFKERVLNLINNKNASKETEPDIVNADLETPQEKFHTNEDKSSKDVVVATDAPELGDKTSLVCGTNSDDNQKGEIIDSSNEIDPKEKNSIISENPLPELSAEIKEKVKALAANIPKGDIGDLDCYAQIDKEGLIGVEYVVKLMKSANDPSPMFECCLCEIVLNEARMQGHLIRYNHRLKYCEMHYSDTIKKYKDAIGHMKYYEFYRIMGPILSKLALAIEKHHGRSIPYEVSAPRFTRKRSEIVALVYSFPHACQQHGPSFSNLVSAKEILELKERKTPFKPPVVPPNHHGRFTTPPTDKIYLGMRNHDPSVRKEDRTGKLRLLSRSKSPKGRNDRYKRTHTRSRSASPQKRLPKRQKTKHLSEYKLPSDDIWKVYREEISIAASEVERSYMEYRRNPENHPHYDQEWNRFWKRRKEELVSLGVDHRSYNYQPEWVHFFRERLEQLFGEALHKSKINVRRRLNIPLDAEEDSQPESPPLITQTSTRKFKDISQKYENSKVQSESTVSRTKSHRFDAESLVSQWNLQSKPTLEWYHNNKSQLPAIADDKPNIIHVLRLMTALEDHLGSLGSKIMDLLSKALVLEKSCNNSPLDLEKKVLTPNNCTLLETAMEKLKGILYAGLLDSNKVQGFTRVIQYTADLLKHAEKMGWRINSDYSEKAESTNDLQKLIDVMKNKNSDLPTSNKSLSDTLMELISSQRGNIAENSIKDASSKQFDYSKPINALNETQGNNFMFSRSSFMGSNISNQQNDRYSHDSRMRVNEMDSVNHMSLLNSNTNLNRNPINFGYSDKSFGSNGNMFKNTGGSGRNSYSNLNFNNKANVNSVGNMNAPTNSSGSNTASNFGPQIHLAPNVNRPLNFYRNAFGNGCNDNWGGIQNNQQWPPNTQLHQYQNKRENGNM